MQNTEIPRSPLLNNWDLEELRYSFVWEDSQCLSQALASLRTPAKRILSIGSAGDNAFAMLVDAPEQVVVLDLSPAQIALIDLKRAAITHLDHASYMNFFIGPATVMYRLSVLNQLRPRLAKATQDYWDFHLHLVLGGIDKQGRLDRYFEKFRTQALPTLWRPADLQAMTEASDLKTQLEYWNQADQERLSRLASEFFSATALSDEGRHASQFKYVTEADTGRVFLKGFLRRIQTQLISRNPYLYYFLTGQALTGETTHPLWNPITYQRIQKNISALSVVTRDLESFLANEEAPFDFMNLSDLFEYLSEAETQNLFRGLQRRLSPHGALAFWTLLVDRKPQVPGLSEDVELSERLTHGDRTWFYSGFHVIRPVLS